MSNPDLKIRTVREEARVVDFELSNRPGVFAIMDLKDAEAWIAAGRSTSFMALSNGQGREYVAFYDPSRAGDTALVARVLLASGTRAVRYRDGDRLNLRRSNLYTPWSKGSGRRMGVPQGPRKPRESAA